MKLISLTRQGGGIIKINPMVVVALEPIPGMDKTMVYTMGGSWLILESLDQIEKKIKEAEKVTLTTWETGPR
jgi:hypothetical protein